MKNNTSRKRDLGKFSSESRTAQQVLKNVPYVLNRCPLLFSLLIKKPVTQNVLTHACQKGPK